MKLFSELTLIIGIFIFGICIGIIIADSEWISDCDNIGLHRANNIYICHEK
jgi:hypothetical protein